MATDMEKKLLESRVILVQGYIDTPKASQIVFELLQMSALNDKEPIQLFIGSTGGNYLDMLAIYDTIRSIPNVVSGIGMGAVSNFRKIVAEETLHVSFGGVVGRNLGVVRNCTEGVSGEIEGIVGETVGTVTKVND